ncbi:hypothetical protein [Sporosarcina sp. UB5]|uniref:hypothetical protein n=1 Tax=Sporosarcina sp. UB5 TaxID=3047463 RepID=UPI003D7903FA
MKTYFSYIPDSKERKQRFTKTAKPAKTRDLATEARAEIVLYLLKEGKTVEEIDTIIRCFGL